MMIRQVLSIAAILMVFVVFALTLQLPAPSGIFVSAAIATLAAFGFANRERWHGVYLARMTEKCDEVARHARQCEGLIARQGEKLQAAGMLCVLMLLFAATAQAQVSGVVMGGDHGKVFALEADTGGLVLRGGLIGRAGVNDVTGLNYEQVMALDRGHEWDVTAGLAWRFRGDMPVSMDLGLDFEPMAPGVMGADGMDVRGRIGGALHVSEQAALFVERTRSLHNGTNYGRWMLGGRVGF